MSSSSFKHQKMQEKVTKVKFEMIHTERLTQTIVLYRAKAHEMMNDCDSKCRTMTCRMQVHLWTEHSVVESESAKTDTNRERLFEDTFEQCNNLQKMLHPSSQLESTWHRTNTSHNHFLYDFCRIAQKMTDCCSPVNHRSRTPQKASVVGWLLSLPTVRQVWHFLIRSTTPKRELRCPQRVTLEVLLFVFCLLYSSLKVLVYKCFVSVLIKDIF